AGLTVLTTAALVYLDMVFVRRLFCRDFCPYGRFQAALVDPGTLTLRFHPDEAKRCIR
ncbi:MAG: FeS-binding protein, partial [Desulfuromonadales bacterium]|nr:FeS-binding protein [Desulfuromonadales bacterium]NIS42570.1 FeS-binding protein [Desulfuromonadales bacterium]